MIPTQTLAPRRVRRMLTALSTVLLASLLAGCAVFSPMSTQVDYNPGDGVAVSLGVVEVRDLIVVGTAQGEPATILAYLVNTSAEDVTVTIGSEGSPPSTVDLAPGAATQISPVGGEGVTLDSLGVALGAMVPLVIQVDSDPPARVEAPTVSTSSPLYSGYEQSGS